MLLYSPQAVFRFRQVFAAAGRYTGCKGAAALKSVIYLDELLLTNFVLAALFLTAAGLLCATVCTGGAAVHRGGAGGSVGTGTAGPELPGAVAVGYKIFTGCAVVAAAYGLPGRGRFARLCAWYALLNLLLCGAVVLPGVQSRNLSVSLPLSPGGCWPAVRGVYAVLRALLYCFGRSGAPSVPATLEVAGCSCRYRPSTTPALPCRSR